MTRIDIEKCKGCGLCAEACPKKIIKISKEKLNSKGFHPAEIVGECIRCGFCAMMCPDVAIEIKGE